MSVYEAVRANSVTKTGEGNGIKRIEEKMKIVQSNNALGMIISRDRPGVVIHKPIRSPEIENPTSWT